MSSSSSYKSRDRSFSGNCHFEQREKSFAFEMDNFDLLLCPLCSFWLNLRFRIFPSAKPLSENNRVYSNEKGRCYSRPDFQLAAIRKISAARNSSNSGASIKPLL